MEEGQDNKEKIRVYVLADDYRWHFITDSAEDFHLKILAYLLLMTQSAKENHYQLKNLFMPREEYLEILKNLEYYRQSSGKIQSIKNSNSNANQQQSPSVSPSKSSSSSSSSSRRKLSLIQGGIDNVPDRH